MAPSRAPWLLLRTGTAAGFVSTAARTPSHARYLASDVSTRTHAGLDQCLVPWAAASRWRTQVEGNVQRRRCNGFQAVATRSDHRGHSAAPACHRNRWHQGRELSRRCYHSTEARGATSATSATAGDSSARQSGDNAPSASGPEAPDYLDDKERAVFEKLKAELAATELEVQDISGGCGTMYAVSIASPRFRGLPVVRQHRLVNQVLDEWIKGWHGLQLRTKAG